MNEGRADYVPVFLSRRAAPVRAGALPLDAVLVNVTPPDAHGFCSLGTSVEAMHAAIRAADDGDRPAQPRDAADARRELHPRRPDRPGGRGRRAAVRAHAPGRSATSSGGSARYVADLVPDGATLQLGIGAIPAATALVPRATSATSGIHTEMFTDAVVDLVEAGVVTGARKERNRGKIVTAFMMGTQRLYEFVDDNPMVEMRPVDFTNDTHVIRSFSRMTAINSAIEVDLTGPGRAPTRSGTRLYSGVGGQMDFIRGAALGRGGPGDHRAAVDGVGGTTSRISPTLAEGAGVVTTRAHVRTVVTECGRRRAVRQEPARARRGADRHRAPGSPRRAWRSTARRLG